MNLFASNQTNLICRHLAVISLLLTAFVPHGLCADAVGANGTVWKAWKKGRIFYLAGSLHLLTRQDYPLPSSFMTAYRLSNFVWFETHPSEWSLYETKVQFARLGYFTNGGSLEESVSKTTWKAVERFSRSYQVSLHTLNKMKPWWAAIQVQQAGFGAQGMESQYGLESYYSALVREDGRRSGSLEPAKEQIQIFADLRPSDQEWFLLSSLAPQQALSSYQVAVRAAWRSGNVSELARLLRQEESQNTNLRTSLLTRRHKRWIEKMLAQPAGSLPTLVVVGCRHLVDERDNLLQYLSREGFVIERVPR